MDELESVEMEDALPEFTLAEIMEMEILFKRKGKEYLNQDFCQDLATSFSCSPYRIGKSSIKWEQVQSWFSEKQKAVAARVNSSPIAVKDFAAPYAVKRSSPVALKELFASSTIPPENTIERPQKPIGERVAELSELVFEALSSKDEAWFDVAAFLNYRVLSTGELEVRVRFAGFGNGEDEWVNVKRAVRERSIPLEPSECHRVKVGDIVLCYRENEDHALYSDARVVEIERKLHDIKGCRCIFAVRFNYDHAEEKVELSRICCRPT